MNKFIRRCGLLAALVATLTGPAAALAQTEFQIALRKKYNFKTVVCATCHPAGKEKTERNEFGTLFAKEFTGKNVSKRLADVKDLDVEDPARVKVKNEVTKQFLEALQKIESLPGPGGEKWSELLKAGKLEGVKLRE